MFSFTPLLSLVNMGSVNQFLCQKVFLFLGTLCSSVSTYLLPLFGFIFSLIFRPRFIRNDSSLMSNSNYSVVIYKESHQKDSEFMKPEAELQTITESEAKPPKHFGKKEKPEFCFEFKFPGYEELRSKVGDTYFDSSEKSPTLVTTFSNLIGDPEIPENSTNCGFTEDGSEKIKTMKFNEDKEQLVNFDQNVLGDQDVSAKIQSDSEKNSFTMDSDLGSGMSPLIDSYNINDGFLSDGDFEPDGESKELHDEKSDSDDSDEEEDSDIMEELRKLEEPHEQNSDTFHSGFLSENDFQEDLNKPNDEKSMDGLDINSEDSNKLETLWEHQELIEQLKMEIKKVRATGLPTIIEESESPKMMEDLKPWKIDEKFQKEDRTGELHKFYKSYRERMRKFDILNYQKMYAIGFLQLKDPIQSISSQKSSSPAFTSILSQNIFQYKHKKTETDPMMRFITEVQSDLEMVYVGQMCLSWEILHWQYGKALELWESDPRGLCRYNEVAGEFQQFQVLMQRFIEDEPFQGPRFPNYVKSRCVLRNLLQVPVIREDISMDRKKGIRRENGEFAITSDMLVEIMEESIRIFWQFVQADKNCANLVVKGRRESLLGLHDPTNFELLMEVRTQLQKKEKFIKGMLRSGKCILKRFRRCEEVGSDQVIYFFSQVDMKLVSRVLNMSVITTEQLVWCRNKLAKITFMNKKKIHVEHSFLLFPC